MNKKKPIERQTENDRLNISVKQFIQNRFVQIKQVLINDLTITAHNAFVNNRKYFELTPYAMYQKYHFKARDLVEYLKQDDFTAKQILALLNQTTFDRFQMQLAIKIIDYAEKTLEKSGFTVTRDNFDKLIVKIRITTVKNEFGVFELEQIQAN